MNALDRVSPTNGKTVMLGQALTSFRWLFLSGPVNKSSMHATPHLTRRRFLGTSLALQPLPAQPGLTFLPYWPLAAGDKRYGGFPMGIQATSLRAFGIDGALDQIQKLNLHYVDLPACIIRRRPTRPRSRR
jgi:hypothetical protein